MVPWGQPGDPGRYQSQLPRGEMPRGGGMLTQPGALPDGPVGESPLSLQKWDWHLLWCMAMPHICSRSL